MSDFTSSQVYFMLQKIKDVLSGKPQTSMVSSNVIVAFAYYETILLRIMLGIWPEGKSVKALTYILKLLQNTNESLQQQDQSSYGQTYAYLSHRIKKITNAVVSIVELMKEEGKHLFLTMGIHSMISTLLSSPQRSQFISSSIMNIISEPNVSQKDKMLTSLENLVQKSLDKYSPYTEHISNMLHFADASLKDSTLLLPRTSTENNSIEGLLKYVSDSYGQKCLTKSVCVTINGLLTPYLAAGLNVVKVSGPDSDVILNAAQVAINRIDNELDSYESFQTVISSIKEVNTTILFILDNHFYFLMFSLSLLLFDWCLLYNQSSELLDNFAHGWLSFGEEVAEPNSSVDKPRLEIEKYIKMSVKNMDEIVKQHFSGQNEEINKQEMVAEITMTAISDLMEDMSVESF